MARGTLLKVSPPKYINAICITEIDSIIAKKALFLLMLAKILSLVVLAVKQVKIPVKMNIAKKALNMYFSSPRVKIMDNVSLFKNQMHKTSTYAPVEIICFSISLEMIFSPLDFGGLYIYS